MYNLYIVFFENAKVMGADYFGEFFEKLLSIAEASLFYSTELKLASITWK